MTCSRDVQVEARPTVPREIGRIQVMFGWQPVQIRPVLSPKLTNPWGMGSDTTSDRMTRETHA